jgi:hypothetical protein
MTRIACTAEKWFDIITQISWSEQIGSNDLTRRAWSTNV